LRYKIDIEHLVNEAAEYEEEDDDFIWCQYISEYTNYHK
jgi:hypothetical protein